MTSEGVDFHNPNTSRSLQLETLGMYSLQVLIFRSSSVDTRNWSPKYWSKKKYNIIFSHPALTANISLSVSNHKSHKLERCLKYTQIQLH
uniref:Uncharacterized protein n=1 Tax=Rhizophora mucronata TaxID=61149 RepID=A0A2P2Q7C6_RHIMU